LRTDVTERIAELKAGIGDERLEAAAKEKPTWQWLLGK
jgi:hypothetical protein